MASVKDNLLEIQEEIIKQMGYCNVNIIAVTKYFNENKIIEAYEAGIRDFGESRVIEALDKISRLPNEIRENSKCHFIGHLQSNKVSKAVGNFDLIHSVDSLKLSKEISNAALDKAIVQKVLLQVNNAEEEQKFGFSVKELFSNFAEINGLKGIKVIGLMNIAPLSADNLELNRLFGEVVEIRNKLEKKFNCKLKEISMGMSNDYIEAVKAGATMVRIGRRLFI
jgi:pyridoxal phosphate enzyme (YggS family)